MLGHAPRRSCPQGRSSLLAAFALVVLGRSKRLPNLLFFILITMFRQRCQGPAGLANRTPCSSVEDTRSPRIRSIPDPVGVYPASKIGLPARENSQDGRSPDG
jgi:hypothetical protein